LSTGKSASAKESIEHLHRQARAPAVQRFAACYLPHSKFRNQDCARELNAIGGRNAPQKGNQSVGHRSVEWRLGFCFQQNLYPRVGSPQK
jgi:hypothetical protein